ncbi:MAG: PQQ-dependent sugar dehydrogenase [Chloroflexi bacterium]|nr:MAG: PQQ-dependent sugar dehydrogenase [Chloroflexota bacterium]
MARHPRVKHAALAFAVMVLASACAGSPSRPTSSPQTTTIAIPTTAPPSSASPTPTASPRIGPAVVENVQLVAGGLVAPWAVDLAPDGRLFVTLGVALDPDFSRNGFVYLYYSYTAANGGTRDKVVRLRDDNGRGTEETVILDGIPGNSNHDGGRVKFGPDGKLYITTGDAENGANAQNPASLAGKILRINKDGSVPADNPTPGSPVWSLGHRNVQGIAWQPDTAALYETEHGPSNPFPDCCHDEVNLIVRGANYGWPTVRAIANDQRFRDPLVESGNFETWAPSGAAFASRPGPLHGSLLFATLRGQHLHRIVFGADGRTIAFQEKLLTGQYGRLRDVYEIASGEFLVLTSNRDGRGQPVPDDDRVLLVTLR